MFYKTQMNHIYCTSNGDVSTRQKILLNARFIHSAEGKSFILQLQNKQIPMQISRELRTHKDKQYKLESIIRNRKNFKLTENIDTETLAV